MKDCRRIAIVLAIALALSAAHAADGEAEPKAGREALFEDDAAGSPAQGSGIKFAGFAEVELAYTTPQPGHWSRILTRAQLDATGAFNANVKWKLSGRVDYDAVYDLTDFYPSAVAHDARFDFFARENYLDIGAGDWDFRLGRQHVVWGEMVGLFFADVVSARDLREFILPDFRIIRIPQWAARIEYFKNDLHAELLWIPVPSYDKIGVPGAQFYPAPPPPPPGFGEVIQDEQFPDRKLSNTNYGLRLSALRGGWDVSAFYYGSLDAQPTFFREIVADPQPTFIYQARHERINQFGATLGKDFGSAVLKAEAVYTSGRQYAVENLTDPDGVVPQNTLEWVVGLEFPLPVADARLNLQLFQGIFLNYDSQIFPDKHESGYSVLLSGKLADRWEAQVLWISSLNRTDWMVRPRVSWDMRKNWRLAFGVDIFDGAPLGLFGRFSDSDRVYADLLYSF